MRDYLILAIVASGLPLALRFPWVGVLYYFWISIMNPHRLGWGLADDFRLALLASIATLIGFLFSSEKKSFPIGVITGLMILFTAHFTLTTFTAFNPEVSWLEWQRTAKIFLMTFIVIALFRDPYRLKWLILVVVFSAAFYGIKGGIFTLVSGGRYMVSGPEDTFFGGNTGLALVLNMILPFLLILGMNSRNKPLRYFYFACFGLTIIAVIGTYSRGGLVGLVFVMLVLFLALPVSIEKRLFTILALAGVIMAGVLFAPQQWADRMKTIETYDQDASALGRINAWWFAYNLANDRPLVGGGFSTYSPDLFLRYAPNPQDFHDAHSIIFEVLADHGYVGLVIYVAIIVCTIVALVRLKKTSRKINSLNWVNSYATMILCSVIGYIGNGLTLGLAYFDLFWLMVSMTVCLKLIVQDHIQKIYIGYMASQKGNAFAATQPSAAGLA